MGTLKVFLLLPVVFELVNGKSRQLSILSVVSFPNKQCTSASDDFTFGTCLSATECGEAGGMKDGNCASGFGVCCVINIKACGGTVSHNLTYIMNPNYPSAFTATSQECKYTVNAVRDNICQLRLDFKTFELNQPPSGTTATTAGTCEDTFTVTRPTGGRQRFSALCGDLSGQHIYLESGTSTVANELTFKTTTSTGNRKWKVQIIQYECESTYKAPPDCLQYHTGVSGTFSSFNFGNIMITSTSYVICIRQERGFCNIGYATNEISGSEYTLSNTGNSISKRTDSCANAQIHIPLDPYSSIFCGVFFNQAQSNTANGVVYSNFLPFRVFVASEGNQKTNPNKPIGFSLKYFQIGCGDHNTNAEGDGASAGNN